MLSIIIPVYNESRRLPATLQALSDYQHRHSNIGECIVVDDGSIDNTAQIASEFAQSVKWLDICSLKQNIGKGGATKIGMLKARGDYIFFMDADLSASLDNLLPAMQILNEEADLVIGSRTMVEANIIQPQPKGRYLAARMGNTLIRQVTGLRYRDTQCGFKGFTRKAAHSIFSDMKTSGYLFDVEILARADRNGYKVVEFPVKWTHQPEGSFRLSRSVFTILGDLSRIKNDMK